MSAFNAFKGIKAMGSNLRTSSRETAHFELNEKHHYEVLNSTNLMVTQLNNNVHALTGFMQAIQPMVTQLNNNVTTQGANIHSLVSEVQTLGTVVHQVAVAQTAQQSQTDQLTAISRQNADIIAQLASLAMSAGQPPPLINKCGPMALGVGVGMERGKPQESGTWGRRAGRRR